MNFCPSCYTELTGTPGPRFKGFCPKCKHAIKLQPAGEGLTAKMNVFVGLNISKEIAQLQRTVDELLAEVRRIKTP